jgi:hypothetical protein
MFLIYSVSNINPNNTTHELALIAFVRRWSWDRVLVKPISFIVSCSRHVVVLYCAKNCCTKVVYFSKIYHHTTLYDPILSVATISQVILSATLVVSIVGN